MDTVGRSDLSDSRWKMSGLSGRIVFSGPISSQSSASTYPDISLRQPAHPTILSDCIAMMIFILHHHIALEWDQNWIRNDISHRLLVFFEQGKVSKRYHYLTLNFLKFLCSKWPRLPLFLFMDWWNREGSMKKPHPHLFPWKMHVLWVP